MSVSYKKLQHILIEREISHSQLMRAANISANIISKIKNGQYIALDKVESICTALDCTPNDILVFLPDSEVKDDTHSKKAENFHRRDNCLVLIQAHINFLTKTTLIL